MAELAALPTLPQHAAHIWRFFQELHSTRSSALGPARLTRAEIRQWQIDEGQHLEPWERQAIMDIDAAWLAAQSEKEA